VANKLGMSIPAIQNWKNRAKVTPRQLAEMIQKTSKAGASNFQATAIRPLVEFFAIAKCESAQGAKYEVFSDKEDGVEHPYRNGLKKELIEHHGVYVFFDSRGQAIYAGKAKRLNLWKEINSTFNRERGEVQKIKRVRHPSRKQDYRTSDEKSRQIGSHIVPLHELASYFSAYDVTDSMIEDLEALLVRSFANDLLNIRMERFTTTRNA
jgi:hypothetical protein